LGECTGFPHPKQMVIWSPSCMFTQEPCYCTAWFKFRDQYFSLSQASENCASASLFCRRYCGLLKSVRIKAIHPVLRQHKVPVKNMKRCALKE
jgi:hypothetical protein